jgi:hypothetical protein
MFEDLYVWPSDIESYDERDYEDDQEEDDYGDDY